MCSCRHTCKWIFSCTLLQVGPFEKLFLSVCSKWQGILCFPVNVCAGICSYHEYALHTFHANGATELCTIFHMCHDVATSLFLSLRRGLPRVFFCFFVWRNPSAFVGLTLSVGHYFTGIHSFRVFRACGAHRGHTIRTHLNDWTICCNTRALHSSPVTDSDKVHYILLFVFPVTLVLCTRYCDFPQRDVNICCCLMHLYIFHVRARCMCRCASHVACVSKCASLYESLFGE